MKVAQMSMLRPLMCLAATAMLMGSSMAVNYMVGGLSGGWDTTTDLQTWATSQAFLVGDNLIFQYTPNHNVLEVSKADYDSCQASNPIQVYVGGSSIIPLASPGSQYFICGTLGHCSQGMKVKIDTLAGSASPPTSPPSAATPTISPIPGPMVSPSPSGSPANSPITPTIPTTESPAVSPFDSPPPPPSAATKEHMMAGSLVGISFLMVILVIP